MARLSKVDRLPAELRDMIGRLREGGHTIDEILAKLRELEADVGRSGLGEYLKRYDAMRERLHHSRGAAQAIMAKLEDETADDRVARFNIASLHAIIMELMAGAEEGEDVKLTAKDVKFLSETMRNLATASKADIDRTERLEKRAAEKARRSAAAAAETAAKEAGLTPERAAEVRRKVLGARPKPKPGPTGPQIGGA